AEPVLAEIMAAVAVVVLEPEPETGAAIAVARIRLWVAIPVPCDGAVLDEDAEDGPERSLDLDVRAEDLGQEVDPGGVVEERPHAGGCGEVQPEIERKRGAGADREMARARDLDKRGGGLEEGAHGAVVPGQFADQILQVQFERQRIRVSRLEDEVELEGDGGY